MSNVVPLRPHPHKPAAPLPAQTPSDAVAQIALSLLRVTRDAPGGPLVVRDAALADRDLHLPDQTRPESTRPANDFRRSTIHTTRLTSPQMLLIQRLRFSVEQLLDGVGRLRGAGARL